MVSLHHEEDSSLEILLLVGEKAENILALITSVGEVQRTDIKFNITSLQVLSLTHISQWRSIKFVNVTFVAK